MCLLMEHLLIPMILVSMTITSVTFEINFYVIIFAIANGDIVRSATNPNLSELQPSDVSPSSSPFMRMRSNSLKAASSSPTGSLRGIKQLDRSSFRMPGGQHQYCSIIQFICH